MPIEAEMCTSWPSRSNGWLQALEELVGDHARVVAVAQLGQHDGELVAALARQRVAAAQAFLQAHRAPAAAARRP